VVDYTFTPPLSGAKEIAIEHTGNWRALLPIVLVNFLLSVITLGFYRFWGKTKVRRYIWQNTVLDGTRLEYTGTGLELFLGFLVAAAIFFVVTLSGEFMFGHSADPTTLGIYNAVFFAFIILFTGFAIYRARNYRLSRTNWRGIRGGMSGSAWRHALRWLGYNILVILSFGFALPWVRTRLQTPLANQSQFGGTNLAFNAPAGPLYRPFLICFGITMATLAGIGLLIVLSKFLSGEAVSTIMDETKSAVDSDSEMNISSGVAAVLGIIGILLASFFYVGIVAIYSCYFSFEMRHFLNHTGYQGLKFKIDADTRSLIKLALGNFFITLLTLGICYPLVQLRNFKFFINRMSFDGALNIDAILQSNQDKPTTGEGWAEMFDVGNV
jgi:uncharacterized membrane protein YjgN (DUF898 family)